VGQLYAQHSASLTPVGDCHVIRVNTILHQLALTCCQLSSSGFGLLNGCGFDFFLAVGGFDLVCLGMGRGLGKG
jgi:hypothetical protein